MTMQATCSATHIKKKQFQVATRNYRFRSQTWTYRRFAATVRAPTSVRGFHHSSEDILTSPHTHTHTYIIIHIVAQKKRCGKIDVKYQQNNRPTSQPIAQPNPTKRQTQDLAADRCRLFTPTRVNRGPVPRWASVCVCVCVCVCLCVHAYIISVCVCICNHDVYFARLVYENVRLQSAKGAAVWTVVGV